MLSRWSGGFHSINTHSMSHSTFLKVGNERQLIYHNCQWQHFAYAGNQQYCNHLFHKENEVAWFIFLPFCFNIIIPLNNKGVLVSVLRIEKEETLEFPN